MTCPERHEDMKRDRALLFRNAVYQGLQDDGEGGQFELWQCVHCKSTIGVHPLKPDAYDDALRAWAWGFRTVLEPQEER